MMKKVLIALFLVCSEPIATCAENNEMSEIDNAFQLPYAYGQNVEYFYCLMISFLGWIGVVSNLLVQFLFTLSYLFLSYFFVTCNKTFFHLTSIHYYLCNDSTIYREQLYPFIFYKKYCKVCTRFQRQGVRRQGRISGSRTGRLMNPFRMFAPSRFNCYLTLEYEVPLHTNYHSPHYYSKGGIHSAPPIVDFADKNIPDVLKRKKKKKSSKFFIDRERNLLSNDGENSEHHEGSSTKTCNPDSETDVAGTGALAENTTHTITIRKEFCISQNSYLNLFLPHSRNNKNASTSTQNNNNDDDCENTTNAKDNAYTNNNTVTVYTLPKYPQSGCLDPAFQGTYRDISTAKTQLIYGFPGILLILVSLTITFFKSNLYEKNMLEFWVLLLLHFVVFWLAYYACKFVNRHRIEALLYATPPREDLLGRQKAGTTSFERFFFATTTTTNELT